mmetsp:Transcript_40361/g.128263  ORF Transcript_40361/g.128263 Transcript_40361/m.128263 type:complete len:171 (-) Transcript_40361:41-553(-)
MAAEPSTLHEAARAGNISRMNDFLDEENVDVDAKDELGRTPLHYVAESGEAAAGALLVECDATVNIADQDGNTPLHITAIHNRRLVTSMLLWGGAEVELTNNKGNTALHEAAASGAKDVAWLILENGKCDSIKDMRNADGKVPLQVAKEAEKVNQALIQVLETGQHVDDN